MLDCFFYEFQSSLTW